MGIRDVSQAPNVLNSMHFVQICAAAIAGCPKSATTWATAGLYKAVAKTAEGIRLLVWLFEVIANAEVPQEVVPLLFDSKRMALKKGSRHQLSIDKLLGEARDNTTVTKFNLVKSY